MNETLTNSGESHGGESQPLSLKQRVEDLITNLFYSQGPGARLTNEELQALKARGADGIEKLQELTAKRGRE